MPGEAGGVELHEGHVGSRAAGPESHGNAVAGAGGRGGGACIDLAATAAGQHDGCGPHRLQLPLVQHAHAHAAILVVLQQVHGHGLFQLTDVGAAGHGPVERLHDREPGVVGHVGDAAGTVPTFACQVQAASIRAAEGHARADQPFDGGTSLREDGTYRGLVAQPGTGHQRVGHMVIQSVKPIQHGGDTALRATAGVVIKPVLAQQRDAQALRQ